MKIDGWFASVGGMVGAKGRRLLLGSIVSVRVTRAPGPGTVAVGQWVMVVSGVLRKVGAGAELG